MANESIISAVVKGLADHLKANVTELQEVHEDFPAPNQKLKYPSATVFTRGPVYTPLNPYIVDKDEDPQAASGTPPEEGPARLFKVRRVVGQYEFRLQIDVWCATKYERNRLYDKLFNALNTSPYVGGLSLKLTDYWDQWARYNIDRLEYGDNEEASQRSEWRILMTVIADVKAIQEGLEALMENVENTLETPNETIEGQETDSGANEDVI